MADTLTQALTGLNVAPSETPWGIGAMSLAQSSPLLMNPYSSWQQNLAIGLGANLVAGLLGYQARQSAMEQNLALQPYITQALKAPNMESLDTILAQEDAAPLRGLGAQLKMNILQNQAAATDRQQNLRDALLVAGIKEGYIPKSLESEYGGIGGDLGAGLGGLTPRQTQELELNKRKLQQGTEIARPEKEAERNLQIDKALLDMKDSLKNDVITKMYRESEANYKTAIKLAGRDEKSASDALKKIVERTLNPGNQVTLNELRGYNDIMPVMRQFEGWAASKTEGLADLSPEARNQLLRTAQSFVDNLGQSYNDQVNSYFYNVRKSGWADDPKLIAPYPLWKPGETAGVTTAPASSIETQIGQLEQIAKDSSVSATTKAAAIAKIDELLKQ